MKTSSPNMTQFSSIFSCTILLLMATNLFLPIIPVASNQLIDAPVQQEEIIDQKTNETKNNYQKSFKRFSHRDNTEHKYRLDLKGAQGKYFEQQLKEQVLPQINEQAKSINGRQYSLKELTEGWSLSNGDVGSSHYNVTLKAYATAPDETVNMLVEYYVIALPKHPCHLKSWRLIE